RFLSRAGSPTGSRPFSSCGGAARTGTPAARGRATRPGLTSIPPFRDTGGRYRGNGTARPRLGGRKRPRGRGRIVGRGPGPAGERPGRRYGSVRAGDLAGQMDRQGPGQGVLRVRGRYVPRRPVRSAQGDREGALLEAMQ